MKILILILLTLYFIYKVTSSFIVYFLYEIDKIEEELDKLIEKLKDEKKYIYLQGFIEHGLLLLITIFLFFI